MVLNDDKNANGWLWSQWILISSITVVSILLGCRLDGENNIMKEYKGIRLNGKLACTFHFRRYLEISTVGIYITLAYGWKNWKARSAQLFSQEHCLVIKIQLPS